VGLKFILVTDNACRRCGGLICLERVLEEGDDGSLDVELVKEGELVSTRLKGSAGALQSVLCLRTQKQG
jgi:hypothetical protein